MRFRTVSNSEGHMSTRWFAFVVAAVTAGCRPEPASPPPEPPKSSYVGRWHSRWNETVQDVASMEHDEYLSVSADGRARLNRVTTFGGRDPRNTLRNFRWAEKDGQFQAFCTDDDFANENGDQADIVAIVNPDGRLVATLLWFQEPTVTYDPVPVVPE